ncbi:5-histidylcysteine sulfoxide synthase [Halosquirtibacter xylanolyticus]|uniref:5-histidylcysteine sulfoxide synthase n=1 Tax=Halosquirtibacter xylanolyticus TaxID=3374599 RepID=UPI0037481ADA|nr:5-histidylcysteine sulfoxide synthase [Prolixibacteraceae bacterium]
MMKTLLSQGRARTVTLSGDNIDIKRAEILSYFKDAVKTEEWLYSGVTDSLGFYKRADPLRHPLIFYFGHTACFFVNKYIAAGIISERINPMFESIFAIGVDEMSWDDLDNKHYDWPPIGEVIEYRRRVFEMVEDVILNIDFSLPINWNSPMWIILMGIEHIRIHIETSSVLIRQLPLQYLSPVPFWTIAPSLGFPPSNKMVDIEEGKLILGKPNSYSTYGWDSEYGELCLMMESFQVSKYLCSNAEYLSFVLDHGYSNREYWSEEGWNWVQYDHGNAPRFWSLKHNKWRLRLVFEEIEMPWDWPVEVNCLEADAFCRWKSKKENINCTLPSEAEWEHLYRFADVKDLFEWREAPGNICLEHYQSPSPIQMYDFNGVYDVIGNVWQWTRSSIDGYKGFKVHPIYDDFSVPTFDQKHNIIKGGSWISTGNEASRYARYAFRRHFYQHAGFRYVISSNQTDGDNGNVVYDSDVIVRLKKEWLNDDGNYLSDVARICSSIQIVGIGDKVLNVGCSTGRSTFELMNLFECVHGVDRTARLIGCGVSLRERGEVSFCDKTIKNIRLRDYFKDFESNRGVFYQTDYANMKPFFDGYSLIVISSSDDLLSDETILVIMIDRILDNGRIVMVHSNFIDIETVNKKYDHMILDRVINLDEFRYISVWRKST